MNIFATIEEEYSFELITLYSIRREGELETLFLQFLKKHEECEQELDYIREWLANMGNRKGLQPQFFRPEQGAYALPPPARYNETGFDCPLRLYCMPLFASDVVILFGGGVKTTRKAQDCPNVAGPFREANKWAKAIQGAIADGELGLGEKCLLMDDDFKLCIP